MRGKDKKVQKSIMKPLAWILAAALLVTTAGLTQASDFAQKDVKAAEANVPDTGGYLAAFIAKYEPNMGLEFAQFPWHLLYFLNEFIEMTHIVYNKLIERVFIVLNQVK